MFKFDELLSLWSFLFVLFTGAIWVYFNFIKPNFLKYTSLLSKRSNDGASKTVIALGVFSIVGWVLLSISAGLPVKYSETKKSKLNVRDIFFVVDVSRSMLAVDFTPNRLEVAKNHIRDFVELRGEDRLGIVMFAEKIITLSPLTYDQNSVLGKISEVNVGFLGNGTNIGDALGLATERLAKSEAKEKIIILLTDGVSNVGNINPLQASVFSKETGVKIYSIGIGTDNTARLPYKVGGKTFYQEIPGGSIDVDTLKQISKSTDGQFYYAKSSLALGKVFNEINKLEKTEVEINFNKKFKYKYKGFLILGLLLVFFCEFIINRKRIFGI